MKIKRKWNADDTDLRAKKIDAPLLVVLRMVWVIPYKQDRL